MSDANMLKPQETPPVGQDAAPGGQPPPGPVLDAEAKKLKLRRIRRKKTLKRSIALVVVAALLGGMVWAVREVFYKPPELYYKTDKVRKVEKLERSIYGYGSVKPMESESLHAEVKGTVLEANGFPGMPVEEGQVLCVIDGAEIDKQVKTLNDDIATEMERIKKADAEIVKITGQMEEEYSDIFAQMRAATLTAPFSGKVLDVPKITIGSKVDKGAALGLLVDDSSMILRQYFSYGYINDIKTGMKADVSIPASMSVLSGTVTRVEKVKNIQTDGTITFEVEMTVKNPGALTREMDATASLTSATGEQILPIEAGQLEYAREEVLSVGASGNMKEYNLHNFYEYKEGDVLARVDFVSDDTGIEGYKTAIQGQQDIIDGANETIAAKNEEIAEAEVSRENLTLKAPMSGTLMVFNAMPGVMVEAGAELCSVAKMTTVLIDSQVSQADLKYVEVGMKIMLTMDGQNDLGVDAKVKSISPQGQGDTNQGNQNNVYYPFVIEADNSQGLLMNSYGVSYIIKLEESLNPLVVPVDAIKPLLEGQCVYVQRDEPPEGALTLENKDIPEGFYAIPVDIGISQQINIDEMYKDVIEVRSDILKEGDIVFTLLLNQKPSPSPTPSDEEESPSPDASPEESPGEPDGGTPPDDGGAVVDDGGTGIDNGGEAPADNGEPAADDGGETTEDGAVPDDGGVIVDDGTAVVDEKPLPADGGGIIGGDGGVRVMPVPKPAG